MSDALSILAAARDAGERPALVADGRTLTFGELAALARERIAALRSASDDLAASAFDLRPTRGVGDGEPYAVVGRNDVATAVSVYALLELRVPAMLLHPRLTLAEQHAVLDAASRAGPLPDPHAAAVLHTSGTTGAPRAAVLGRDAFIASAQASEANLGWEDDDRWLLCMPLAHVGGLSILTRCLAARRCVVLASGFDAATFPQVLRDAGVTLLSLVPTMLTRVLDAHPQWQPAQRLRAILLGGAPTSPRLIARAVARRVPVLPSYGLTETCSQVTTVPYAARFDPTGLGSGPALPGARIRVRDDAHIEVAGPMLMTGYWGEAPHSRDAWLDTGDMGVVDGEGCLHVQARRHDLIVTGGENVYPIEVEHVLEACPGIEEAGVLGLPDDVWGETVAAVLAGDPDVASPSAIAEHVRSRLAPHKWPRRIAFVARLPHTGAGKLDRAALPAHTARLQPLSYRVPQG